MSMYIHFKSESHAVTSALAAVNKPIAGQHARNAHLMMRAPFGAGLGVVKAGAAHAGLYCQKDSWQ